MSTTRLIEDLQILHDVRVVSWSYQIISKQQRALDVILDFRDGVNGVSWGIGLKKVSLIGVAFLKAKAFGAFIGEEILLAWDPITSAPMQTELTRLREMGINVGNLVFALSFNSGSEIEVACEDVMVAEVARLDE